MGQERSRDDRDELPQPPRFLPHPAVYQGGELCEGVFCLSEDNATPMTYTGTNTWIVGDPGSDVVVVIDPGDVDPAHLDALARHVAEHGKRVGAVVLTHEHHDHAGGAQACADRFEAPLLGWRAGTLHEGAFVACEGAPLLEIVHTPGHSEDSVSVLYPHAAALFTGDVVFDHGPTVVFYPDGNLSQYLETLNRLQQLAEQGRARTFCPGHGWPFAEPAYFVEATRAHRLERLEQIRQALASGVAAQPEALAEAVYADVDPKLRMATIKSIQAQLEHLGKLEK